MRPNVFGLSLEYPNHLIETIKGTVIDSFGNILDINRNILPIGKQNLSLRDAANKSKTYLDVRQELRKSLAMHVELNTRKPEKPDLSQFQDFGKSQSNFLLFLE